MGGLGAATPGSSDGYVYAARVPASQSSVSSVSAYEYWNGSTWGTTRLTDPDFEGFAPAAVLFPNAPQGSIFNSAHYNLYVYLYPGAALSGRKYYLH